MDVARVGPFEQLGGLCYESLMLSLWDLLLDDGKIRSAVYTEKGNIPLHILGSWCKD